MSPVPTDPIGNLSYHVPASRWHVSRTLPIRAPATLHWSWNTEANKPISFGCYESRLRDTGDTLWFIYLFIYPHKCGPTSPIIVVPASIVTTADIKARTAPLRAFGEIKLDAKHQSFSKVVSEGISESNLDASAAPSRRPNPQTETRIYAALTLVTAA